MNLDIGSFIPNQPGENATIIEHIPAVGQTVPEGTKVELKFYVPVNKLVVPFEIIPVDIDMQPEPLKVVLEATPSDTNIPIIVYTRSHMKSAFPITVQVEIPENGATILNLLINNIPNTQTILYYEDFLGQEGVYLIEVNPPEETDTGDGDTTDSTPSE